MKPNEHQRETLLSLADDPAYRIPGGRYRLQRGKGKAISWLTTGSLVLHGWATHQTVSDGFQLVITPEGLAAVQQYL